MTTTSSFVSTIPTLAIRAARSLLICVVLIVTSVGSGEARPGCARAPTGKLRPKSLRAGRRLRLLGVSSVDGLCGPKTRGGDPEDAAEGKGHPIEVRPSP